MRESRSKKRPAGDVPSVFPKPSADELAAARPSTFPGIHDVHVAVYVRLGPVHAEGPDEQLRVCRDALARLIPGPIRVEPFVDVSRAGSPIDRPGLRDLLEAAAAGLVDVVAIQSLDRLARDHETLRSIHAELEWHSVAIVTADRGRIEAAEVVMSGFRAQADRDRRRGLAASRRSMAPA